MDTTIQPETVTSSDKNVPAPSTAYRASQACTILTSFLLLLWRFSGLTISEMLNWSRGWSLPNHLSYLPHLVAVALLYSVYRLIFEWVWISAATRSTRLMRFDLGITIAVVLAAMACSFSRLIAGTRFHVLSLWLVLACLCLGIAFGFAFRFLLVYSQIIRSESEAKKLGLPRVPAVVHAMFRMCVPIAFIGLLGLIVMNAFQPVLSAYVLAFVFVLGALPWAFSFCSGGFKRKVEILRKAARVDDYGYYLAAYEATEMQLRRIQPGRNRKMTQSTAAQTVRNISDISKGRLPLRTILIEECVVVWHETDNQKYLTLCSKKHPFKAIPIEVRVATEVENSLSEKIELPYGRIKIPEERLRDAPSGSDLARDVIGMAINVAVTQYLDKRALITWQAKTPEDEMHVAIVDGNMREVQRLHSTGVSVDCEFKVGWRPLMLAVAQGEDEIARYLLEKGADPNAANVSGRTALHFAMRYGNEKLCRLLTGFGGALDAQCREGGNTPLMLGAAGGHNSCVTYLLKHGAKVGVLRRDGETAESIARKMGYGTTARIISRLAKQRPSGATTGEDQMKEEQNA